MKPVKAARAEAESIAKRWVPDHMRERAGLVDDIAAALVNVRALENEACKEIAWEARNEKRLSAIGMAQFIRTAIAARRAP